MNCASVLILVILAALGLYAYRRLSRQGTALRARLDQLELELSLLRPTAMEEPVSTLPERPAETAEAPPTTAPSVSEEPAPAASDTGLPVSPPTPPAIGPEPPPAVALPAVRTPEAPLGGRPDEPSSSRPAFDLEQWVGVRGAAVLGGIVLAIAGFFFLRYSIEAGWLKPAVRVALGTLAGVGSIVAAQTLRRRAYDAAANALSGAGIVVLYASTWAARVLYGLIGYAPAFVVMVVVTVTCGVLSWRYRSLVVALLGLVGGFATPLLLASGRDNPLGLFGYLLLINTGLAILARRSRWPLLGPLSLAATLLYQTLWIFARMRSGEGPLALAILAVFAVFFVVTTGAWRRSAERGGAAWSPWLQATALGTPFAFALYFAANATLDVGLVPLAALLALLGAGAAWLARIHGLPRIEEGIAAATVAVIAVWWLSSAGDGSASWTAVLVTVALAAVFHLGLEIDRRRGAPGATPGGALVASLGFLAWLLAVLVIARSTDFWALVAGWLGHAGLMLRQSVLRGSPHRQRFAALGLGTGFLLLILDEAAGGRGLPHSPEPAGLLALMIAIAFGFQLFALAPRANRAQTSAALVAAAPLLGLLFLPDLGGLLFHGAGAILLLLVLVAATRSSSAAWYGAAAALLMLADTGWALASTRETGELALAFPFQLASAALLTFWPFLTGSRQRRPLLRPMDLRIAALVAPSWFFSLVAMFEDLFGDTAEGLVPVALAALSLGAVAASRRMLPVGDAARRVAVVWFSAAALSLASVAIPLQLHREWITVGWAIEGFAILLLWRRLDHPGLKYFGLALLAATSVRLVANPALLEYHSKAALPVLNWLLYTYLVPAAALVGAARVLETQEVARQRPGERWLYERGWPVGALSAGVAAIVVVFVWINLTVTDAFSPGPSLLFDWHRLPARDLTLSLAWAVYALLLLGLGVARSSVGLRWISLTVLVLTIAKVFLYDLGELRDLYRVASLVGLAVSLILVSLLYQRFVFRKPGSGNAVLSTPGASHLGQRSGPDTRTRS